MRGVVEPSPRDPFGRPRVRRFVLACGAVAAVMGFTAWMARRSGRSWEAIGSAGWLGGAYLAWFMYVGWILWRRPKARARRVGSSRVLEMSGRGRAALLLVTAPGYVAACTGPLEPGAWEIIGRALLVVLPTLGLVPVMRRRYLFDEGGVTWGQRRLRWSEVQSIGVYAQSVELRSADRRLVVWNRLLQGYPEFAAELLKRVPPAAFRSEAERILLAEQARTAAEDEATGSPVEEGRT